MFRYDILVDMLALVGLGLVIWGLSAIYWPLAPLITGGLILLAVAYSVTRQGVKRGYTDEPDEAGDESER